MDSRESWQNIARPPSPLQNMAFSLFYHCFIIGFRSANAQNIRQKDIKGGDDGR